VLERLTADLREGLRFSAALARQPDVFPPLYVGIVRAAEGTSDLPRALSRYIDYQTRLDTVRNRMVSAAIYPAILLVVGGGVTFFLMGYVVPRFAGVYQGSGRSLPWLSQLLLDWGQFVGQHSGPVFGCLLAGARRRLLAAPFRPQRSLDRLPDPFARDRRARPDHRAVAPVPDHRHAARRRHSDPQRTRHRRQCGLTDDARRALLAARRIISDGGTLSQAFDSSRLATPIALRMLRVGERSGQMGAMLTRSALFYEGESARWIERFTKVFEPVLMTAIGLLVGLIVILLYMPIFDLAGTLQ
jgi:general secretion pathway protein F